MLKFEYTEVEIFFLVKTFLQFSNPINVKSEKPLALFILRCEKLFDFVMLNNQFRFLPTLFKEFWNLHLPHCPHRVDDSALISAHFASTHAHSPSFSARRLEIENSVFLDCFRKYSVFYSKSPTFQKSNFEIIFPADRPRVASRLKFSNVLTL